MNYNDKECGIDSSNTLMNKITTLEDTANYSVVMDKVIKGLLDRINEPRKIFKEESGEKLREVEEISFSVVELVENAQIKIFNSLQNIERNINEIRLKLF